MMVLIVITVAITQTIARSPLRLNTLAEVTSANGNVAGATACPSIDVNGDYILDLVDFAEFSKYYRKSCIAASNRQQDLCPSIDSNGDEMIDLVDLAYFSSRYHDVCFI